MPPELITQKRLDGLWNEKFQGLVRAALQGENVDGLTLKIRCAAPSTAGSKEYSRMGLKRSTT